MGFFTIFPGAVPVTDQEKKSRANDAASQIHLSNEDLRELLTHLIFKTNQCHDGPKTQSLF